jgi:DNA modification methylase
VRIGRVLPYREAKDEEDEKHIHPLQLDVIERALVLWSNPGEVLFTPFLGVGSEVFCAVELGRRGVGVELKRTYYHQAIRNLEIVRNADGEQGGLFDFHEPQPADDLDTVEEES